MQQDDVSANVGIGVGGLRDDTVHDFIGGRLLPVVGIDMQADRVIAHRLSDLDRHGFVCRGRLRIAKIWRAEQPHRAAGQSFDQTLIGIDLQCDQRIGQLAEIGMGKSVIADVVSLGEDAPQQVRIGLGVLADDEETGVNAFLLQHVEDLGRPVRIRTVVEG